MGNQESRGNAATTTTCPGYLLLLPELPGPIAPAQLPTCFRRSLFTSLGVPAVDPCWGCLAQMSHDVPSCGMSHGMWSSELGAHPCVHHRSALSQKMTARFDRTRRQ